MDVIGFLFVSLGNSTVQFHHSLGSRRAWACSEAGFSSQNGERAWGVYYRKPEFFLRFCGQTDSVQRIFIKKYFLFTVGSVSSRKAIHNWIEKRGKLFADDEELETEERKLLRQESKALYAVGFDALVKRWDVYQRWWRIRREINVYFRL
jgi:hypothetical protein